jgi:hypothetical protein
MPTTLQECISAWNAQADKFNQWPELDADERCEWCLKLSTTVPLDMALLPMALTAENGAKALMIGEFSEVVNIGDEENIEILEVLVSWTTIKEIYQKIVSHFTS